MVQRDVPVPGFVMICASMSWRQIPPLLSDVVDKLGCMEICQLGSTSSSMGKLEIYRKMFGIVFRIQLFNLFSII